MNDSASDNSTRDFPVKSLELVSDITDRAACNYIHRCRRFAVAATAANASARARSVQAGFYIDPVRLKTASSISDDSGDDPTDYACLRSANKYLMKDFAGEAIHAATRSAR